MKKRKYIKSKISGIPRSNPFSVPESYFDSFPQKIQERLELREKVRLPEKPGIWEVIRPQIALAAAITAFAILGYLMFRNFIIPDRDLTGNDAVADYIEFYNHEFSEHYLISLLEDNGISQDYSPYPENGSIYEEFGYNDDIDAYMEYLYDENIDIYLILTEF